jgi:hypothetical protein
MFRVIILEIMEGLWFRWRSKLISPLFPKKTSRALNILIQSLSSAMSLPAPWKEAKIVTLQIPAKDPKFLQNSCPISKLFEKLILSTIQKHIGERNLLNASQFGFRPDHSAILQWMKLEDHVTLNFNNKMSTAAVFLDIGKAFDTTWHSGLLYKLSELEFSTSYIKVFASLSLTKLKNH